MKRFLAKQFLNIIFIVLIVAAALTIYFLSRSEKEAASLSATPTQAVATPEPKPVFSGIPESVFITHLESAESFHAERSNNEDRAWIVTVGESPEVTATLIYTVDDGAVSSVELGVILPSTQSQSSESSIERALAANAEEARAACNDAVRLLICDLIPACDSEDALSAAQVRLWAENATQIQYMDDDYDDKSDGCQFMAYLTKKHDQNILVCVFFANA